MSPLVQRVRIIVLGSIDRGDDGVGPLAVAELPEALWPLVDVRLRGTLDVVDLADVPPGGACLVVDAARGLPAGAIRFIPFTKFLGRGRTGLPEPRSSHELPVGDVVRLAALVRGRLPRGGFLVAGGSSFGLGELPSREVALAVPTLVDAIATAIESFRTRRGRASRSAGASPCASR